MINQEIKKQWIEALKSGKYTQGFDRNISLSEVNDGLKFSLSEIADLVVQL